MKETVTLSQPSEHERELTVTLPKSLVNNELNIIIDSVSKTASRPGFRPGKMPRNMVISFYNQQIKQQLKEKLFEKSFDHACKDHNLVPVSQPKWETLSNIDNNEPFIYKAIFQVKPNIENPIYQNLNLEFTKFTFDDTDIENELKSMQAYAATFKEITERNIVQEQDLIIADVTFITNGVIDSTKKDESIHLYDEHHTPHFVKSALIGKKIGDKVDVNVPDEDVNNQRDLHITIEIKSIKERILPNIDDDLVKDLSNEFNTLDEVKASIKLRLQTTAQQKYEYFKQEAITKALIEKNPFLVPPALIERMALSLINREMEAMNGKISPDFVKDHWQEIWDHMQQRAEFRVKAELIFESLIKSLNIKVSEEEINNRISKIKNINKEDAAYSLEIEKLLYLIEQQSQITFINEALINKEH